MNSRKNNYSINTNTSNLIGEKFHRIFISIQASYGFAQRGGVKIPYASNQHLNRLVSDVNLLTSREKKQLVFSESIISN